MIEQERRSNWSADERKMKHKHRSWRRALMCTSANLARCLFCAWRIMQGLTSGTESLPNLKFFSYPLTQTHGYPSTQKYTYLSVTQRNTHLSSLLPPLKTSCPMKWGWMNRFSDNNSNLHGDEFTCWGKCLSLWLPIIHTVKLHCVFFFLSNFPHFAHWLVGFKWFIDKS